MSKIVDEVVAANGSYASSFGAKAELALPPARKFAILTCMDARLDPAKYAGLSEGDAHVIRNAGGRATDDAIRSLVISHKLLGTREWFVIHHTNCGMELFADEVIADLLDDDLGTASFDGKTCRTRIIMAVMPPAISSSGTRLRTRNRASPRTCAAYVNIRSCPRPSRSTAMSMTSIRGVSMRSSRRQKRVGRQASRPLRNNCSALNFLDTGR
jgi:hypothetical protein